MAKEDLKVKPSDKKSKDKKDKTDEKSKATLLVLNHPEVLYSARKLFHNENGKTIIEETVPRGDKEITMPRNQGDLKDADFRELAVYASSLVDDVLLKYDEKVAYEDALTRAIGEKDSGRYAGKVNASTFTLILDQMGKKTSKKAALVGGNPSENAPASEVGSYPGKGAIQPQKTDKTVTEEIEKQKGLSNFAFKLGIKPHTWARLSPLDRTTIMNIMLEETHLQIGGTGINKTVSEVLDSYIDSKPRFYASFYHEDGPTNEYTLKYKKEMEKAQKFIKERFSEYPGFIRDIEEAHNKKMREEMANPRRDPSETYDPEPYSKMYRSLRTNIEPEYETPKLANKETSKEATVMDKDLIQKEIQATKEKLAALEVLAGDEGMDKDAGKKGVNPFAKKDDDDKKGDKKGDKKDDKGPSKGAKKCDNPKCGKGYPAFMKSCPHCKGKKASEEVLSSDDLVAALDEIAGSLESQNKPELMKLAFEIDKVADVLEGKADPSTLLDKTAYTIEGDSDEKYMKEHFKAGIKEGDSDEKSYMTEYNTDTSTELKDKQTKGQLGKDASALPYRIVK